MAMQLYRKSSDPGSFSDLYLLIHCLPGIAAAGFLYPIIAAVLIFLRYGVLQLINFPLPVEDLSRAAVTCCFWVLSASIGGIAIAFLSSWVSGLILCLLNHSLGRPLSPKMFVSIVGGLSGFLPFLLFFIHPDSILAYPEAREAILIGPCLATFVGQLGARFHVQYYVIFPANTREKLNVSQFKILHFFSFTAWCAALLTLIRASEGTSIPFLCMIYFPLQIICLLIAEGIDFYRNRNSESRFVD